MCRRWRRGRASLVGVSGWLGWRGRRGEDLTLWCRLIYAVYGQRADSGGDWGVCWRDKPILVALRMLMESSDSFLGGQRSARERRRLGLKGGTGSCINGRLVRTCLPISTLREPYMVTAGAWDSRAQAQSGGGGRWAVGVLWTRALKGWGEKKAGTGLLKLQGGARPR